MVLLWTLLHVFLSGAAQEVDSQDNINAVKRDTSFIYAESTMMDAVEALSGARAILEMKLHEWLRNNHPGKNADVLVSESKEKWLSLLTKRGKYNRLFVYVSKYDVVPGLKPKEEFVEDPYNLHDKVAFVKRMYKDFFDNKSFDKENLSNLQQYLSSEVIRQIPVAYPFDESEDSDSSYVVDFLIDGSLSAERPDPGDRVVSRSIKPMKNDWFVVTNNWDIIDRPITVGLKVQNTNKGLRVVDFSTEGDEEMEGLSPVENTPEDWEYLISSEGLKMISLVKFDEIEPYIKQLKADDRINGYGKYRTMPKDDNCYLFIYNKEGEIVTVLEKTPLGTYNLKTRAKDVISNYKNCGAIWFTLMVNN